MFLRRSRLPARLVGLLVAGLLALPAAAAPADAGSPPARTEAAKPGAAPAADCTRAVALRIQHRYDAIRDLRAHFVQRTERVALGNDPGDTLEASGEVVFAKPGRMRWDYQKPAPSLVVSDGTTLWIYDPEAKEVQRLPLGPEFLSGAAIQFLLGEGHLLDEFSVKAERCGEPEAHLILTPRRDAPYEHLELLADPRSGEVHETVVVDLFGNRTRVTLEDVQVDTRPAAQTFRFVPPKGTRVLSLPPSS